MIVEIHSTRGAYIRASDDGLTFCSDQTKTTEARRRGLQRVKQHCNPNEIQYQGKLAAISGWRTRLRSRFENSVNESIFEAFPPKLANRKVWR